MPRSDEQVLAHGRSDDEVFNSPPSLARSASDWATSAIRGMAKSAVSTVGALGDVPAAIVEKGYELGVPKPPEGGLQAFPGGSPFPTTEQITKKIGGEGAENAAGKFLHGKPETPGGAYAESVGEFAVPSAFGKGGLVKKAGEAVGGGVGSEAAGQLAEKYLPDHPVLSRIIGGILGSKTPAGISKVVTPFPLSPERQAMVSTLKKEGVEPTAGDVSGSKALKYAEHGLGDAPGSGGKYADARERIGTQFTSAVLKRVGETADRATPEVVDRAFKRIGGDFDGLSARNNAQLDPQYFTEIFQAQREYDHLFVDPLKKPVVQKVIDHAVNQLTKSGVMDGEQYKALRSRIEGMRRSYHQDPEVQDFLGDVRKSMDDLMERSIAQNNPADLGAWKKARQEYRNMLVLEKAATGAGETAAQGIVTPAKLREALVNQSRRGYARGQGDFADLARAGEGVLKPPPTSGTAERAWIHAIPAALGAGIGEAAGGNVAALPGAIAGVAAPGMVGRGLMSPAAQAYFSNQVLGKTMSPSALDALVRSFIAAKAHEDRS